MESETLKVVIHVASSISKHYLEGMNKEQLLQVLSQLGVKVEGNKVKRKDLQIAITASAKEDFVSYLKEQLIPDLKESGSKETAKDFETLVAFIKGASFFGGFKKDDFVEYLEGTLIPDLEEMGSEATAKDFQEGITLIAASVVTADDFDDAEHKDAPGTKPAMKDMKRLQDIKAKSGGSNDKALQLCRQMAGAIGDSEKALRRARAAKAVFPGALGQKMYKIFMEPWADKAAATAGSKLPLSAIPKDYPVQPLKPGQKAKDPVTCGDCGLSWDDAIPTGMTPAPSARCPFEAFHK
jgi:hypothetical protein